MDDTDGDTLVCGVAEGRGRGDEFGLFALGRLPAHRWSSRMFAGKKLSRPECRRLGLEESWALAWEPDAMAGDGYVTMG